MEVLFAARALWRHKLVVALGLIAAAAVGALYASRPAPAGGGGAAWTRVILDTPSSQLVDAAPSAAETLPWRAQMLADLMKTTDFTNHLAAGMGVPATDVDVVNETLVQPPIAASVPAEASKSAELVYAPYVVSPSLPTPAIPLIVVYATAPDVAQAKKLASVAVDVLRKQSTRPGQFSSSITTVKADTNLEPFNVEQVAPIQTESLAVAPNPLVPAGVAFAFFLAWCGAIVFVLVPLRRLRARRLRYVPV